MILLEINQMYYNTQVYFRKNHIDELPNDDKTWAKEYSKWLAEQGCFIVHSNDRVLRNSLGVAPHYDKFGFKREEDAVQFTLRWL